MIREAIAAVVAGRDLTEDEASVVMREVMNDEATPSQIAAFLTGLRLKGESVDEMTGMVRVMREKALPLQINGDVLDIVSTGGGSFDPFNISTTAAIVAAGAGVRVAKHGNRGFTSTAGAADVLEALGAKIDLSPEQAQECIDKSGFVFMLATSYHPAMRFAGPTRREIGIRTVFNSLGPMTNPAGARRQLIGVGDPRLVEKIALVMARLGTERVLIVHGDDGLDEVSLEGETQVYEVTGNNVGEYKLRPEDAGMERVPLASVKTGTAVENAARVRAVLAGTPGPDREYTLINAGVGLVAAGKAKDAREGVELAKQSIASGAAARVLEGFIAASKSFDA